MGVQFKQTEFCEADYNRFNRELRTETLLLRNWISEGRFSSQFDTMGIELEGWIISNKSHCPNPVNHKFLKELNHPQVVTELSKFNIELNSLPVSIEKQGINVLRNQMEDLWSQCQKSAKKINSHLLMIGSAPTLEHAMLKPEAMSEGERYSVLTNQLIKSLNNQEVRIHLTGVDTLDFYTKSILPASAATSLQIQWKVPAKAAHLYFNAAQVLSPIMVAISANSPFIFGKELWHESRIPLFEHAVGSSRSTGKPEGSRRAHFGQAHLENCISNYFFDCIEKYDVLIPLNEVDQWNPFGHIQFHNGTIWKWNRPVIGFDRDSEPHMRIEHRPMSAGPSIVDCMANSVFYLGCSQYLANTVEDFERVFPFSNLSKSFYQCARNSYKATIPWRGNLVSVQNIVLDHLLEIAQIGLNQLSVDSEVSEYYLGIIEQRALKNLNGALWQLNQHKKHGKDFKKLSQIYLENQESHLPIHEWES